MINYCDFGCFGCIGKIEEQEGKRNPIPGLGVRTLHPDFGKHISDFLTFLERGVMTHHPNFGKHFSEFRLFL